MNEREQELLVTGYVAGYMDKEAADAGKPGVMDSIGSSLKGALNYVKNKAGEATDYMGGKADEASKKAEDIWNHLSEKERIALLTGAGAAGGAGIGAGIAGGPGAAIGAGVGGVGAGAGYAGYSNRDALAKVLKGLGGKTKPVTA